MSAMNALFLGGHPAVDFLNTAFTPDGQAIETIADGKGFVDWLVAAQLLDVEAASALGRRFGTKALDQSAEEARRLREWTREWLSRWRAAPRKDYRVEVKALNKLLERVTVRWEVMAKGPDMTLVPHPRIDAAESLVGLVASQIAAFITHEQPDLLKQCAGSGCTLWFLDRTKAHSRRFCSAAICGNRAKVSAFRERQRSAG